MIKEHNKAEEEIEGERDKGAFFLMKSLKVVKSN